MMDQGWQSLKGQFLVAMPGLGDPNFFQSVTCLSEHNARGAMGIVISRVLTDVDAGMIFDELEIPCTPGARDIPVYFGGPVHAGEIFVLHGPPFAWEGSMMITPEVGLSNSKDILEAVAAGYPPKGYLIALGCAGWGPGQLEQEIHGNAWITGPFDPAVAFDMPAPQRWESAMKGIGIDPSLLSDTAGHA